MYPRDTFGTKIEVGSVIVYALRGNTAYLGKGVVTGIIPFTEDGEDRYRIRAISGDVRLQDGKKVWRERPVTLKYPDRVAVIPLITWSEVKAIALL